jgi:hypothetical protein
MTLPYDAKSEGTPAPGPAGHRQLATDHLFDGVLVGVPAKVLAALDGAAVGAGLFGSGDLSFFVTVCYGASTSCANTVSWF